MPDIARAQLKVLEGELELKAAALTPPPSLNVADHKPYSPPPTILLAWPAEVTDTMDPLVSLIEMTELVPLQTKRLPRCWMPVAAMRSGDKPATSSSPSRAKAQARCEHKQALRIDARGGREG